MKIKNFFGHLKTVCKHKYWVGKYCFKIGLYKQGLLHDLSKYSPTEFFESVKYYQGTSSPIDASKAENGYSMAWFHHRGRNLHHHVTWIDNFDETGGTPILMPYKYFAEMICDFLAAGRAYQGKKFNFITERKWWQNKKSNGVAMPKNEIAMIDFIFDGLAEKEAALGPENAEKWAVAGGLKYLIETTYNAYRNRVM